MPIYEYRCQECGQESTFVTLSVKSSFTPECKKCGSHNLEKIISRVAISRSEESRLGRLADPSKLSGLDESDPKSLGRWMRKMGQEMGEDLGEDFDQAVEESIKESEMAKRGEEGGGGEEDI